MLYKWLLEPDPKSFVAAVPSVLSKREALSLAIALMLRKELDNCVFGGENSRVLSTWFAMFPGVFPAKWRDCATLAESIELPVKSGGMMLDKLLLLSDCGGADAAAGAGADTDTDPDAAAPSDDSAEGLPSERAASLMFPCCAASICR